MQKSKKTNQLLMDKLSTKFYIIFFLVFLVSTITQATTYYVSSTGRDYNSGTSINSAWASVNAVNSKRFYPGDVILFEGGKTFTGKLYFDNTDKGTASSPIVIGSYGKGWATISSDKAYGLYAYNTAGFKINRLKFKGAGRTISQSAGVYFYMTLASARLDYVNIDSVEVYGYRETGVMFGSWNQGSGYDNVRVTRSKIHDNGNAGISTFAQATLGHKNLYIAHNKVYNNAGISSVTSKHTGSGIMLSGVNGATVEFCEAYNNGWLNAFGSAGPVGIWAYKCNNVVMQHNEAHHNKTGTSKDGGGFDLDGGCTNSVMQYNYSHDNDGAGYMFAQFANAPTFKNNVIRYNITENDGRKNGYAGIQLWSSGANGGIQDVDVYNNTIFISPTSNGTASGIYVMSSYIYNAKIRNNVVQTTGGLQVVRSNTSSGIRFEGNAYWSSGASFKLYYAGITYASLEKWRDATGQEKVNGVAKGVVADPAFVDPGKGVTIGDPTRLTSLTSYKLKSNSGVLNKGLNLEATFGTNVGKTDFWKNNIDQKSTFHIGSYQAGTTSGTTTPTTSSSRIEAEKYTSMSGVSTETTTDTGGGLNVKSLDAGNWMKYTVSVNTAGTYTFKFRVASGWGGSFEVRNGSGGVLKSVSLAKTGGFQNWTTISTSVPLSAGSQTIQIFVKSAGWNFNWLEVGSASTQLASARSEFTEDLTSPTELNGLAVAWSVYPNPTPDKVQVKIGHQIEGEVTINLMDASGRTIEHVTLQKAQEEFTQTISLESLNRGLYFIHLEANGVKEVKKIIKQ